MQRPPMNIPRRPGRDPRQSKLDSMMSAADRLGVRRGSVPGVWPNQRMGRRPPPQPRPQGLASLGTGMGGRPPPPGMDPRMGRRPPPPGMDPRRMGRRPQMGPGIGASGRGGPPMMQGGGVPPEMGPPPEMAMGPPPEMGPPPPALNSPASPLDMMRGADPMGGPPMGGGEGEGAADLPIAIADTLLLNTASPDEALAILDQAREEILAQMTPEGAGMGGERLDALADPMMMG